VNNHLNLNLEGEELAKLWIDIFINFSYFKLIHYTILIFAKSLKMENLKFKKY
jgi:hypothetical protein